MSAALLPASLPMPSPYREMVLILALAVLIYEARRVVPGAAGRVTRAARVRPGARAARETGRPAQPAPVPGETLRIRNDDAPRWGDADPGVLPRTRHRTRTILVLLVAAALIAAAIVLRVRIAGRGRRPQEDDFGS